MEIKGVFAAKSGNICNFKMDATGPGRVAFNCLWTRTASPVEIKEFEKFFEETVVPKFNGRMAGFSSVQVSGKA